MGTIAAIVPIAMGISDKTSRWSYVWGQSINDF